MGSWEVEDHARGVGEGSGEVGCEAQEGLAGVADDFPTELKTRKRSRLGLASLKSSGRPTRLNADRRLYRSALSRSQAALAPNFWLGSAHPASSFISTSWACSIVPALPRCQLMMSRPLPPFGSDRLVTMQKCLTPSSEPSKSPWAGRTRIAR